jgi:hypothetical protein
VEIIGERRGMMEGGRTCRRETLREKVRHERYFLKSSNRRKEYDNC